MARDIVVSAKWQLFFIHFHSRFCHRHHFAFDNLYNSTIVPSFCFLLPKIQWRFGWCMWFAPLFSFSLPFLPLWNVFSHSMCCRAASDGDVKSNDVNAPKAITRFFMNENGLIKIELENILYCFLLGFRRLFPHSAVDEQHNFLRCCFSCFAFFFLSFFFFHFSSVCLFWGAEQMLFDAWRCPTSVSLFANGFHLDYNMVIQQRNTPPNPVSLKQGIECFKRLRLNIAISKKKNKTKQQHTNNEKMNKKTRNVANGKQTESEVTSLASRR